MNAKCNMRVPYRATALAIVMSLAGLIPLASVVAAEAPPERMTYQGFVVDGNGVALGKTAPQNYEVIFRIWKEQSGNNISDRLWSEQQTVTIDKGYMSVLLGEGANAGGESRPPLSQVFVGADASERYIGITVKGIGVSNSDVDILPRLRLVTSPFAYMAGTATKVVNSAIGSAQIIDNTLTVNDIGPNAVGSSEVIDNSLTSSDLGAGSVGSSEVIDDSLTSSDLAVGSVGGSEIADRSITASDVSYNAIGSYEITDGSIVAGDLSEASLGSPPYSVTVGTGNTAGFYYWSWISDATVRKYLADADGGTVKLIIKNDSTGAIQTINEWIAIDAGNGKGFCRQAGGGEASFSLRAGVKYDIIPTPWNAAYIRNYDNPLNGSTVNTDLSLYLMSAPGYDVTFIIYDN